MDENARETLALLRRELDAADRVLVGAGAGLSAAAGLSYLDAEVFRKYFPDMYRLGYRCQYELVGMKDDEWTPGRKWAYWATHIHYVREILPPLPLYGELLALLEGKDFFVVTSNADRQFMRGGFPMERLFEFQGNYDVLGCSKRCTEHTWESLPALREVLKHIDHETFECPEEAIPRCPYCGAPAEIAFRPENYEEGYRRYADFVNSSAELRLCIVEIGVGFNTPGVIRRPFERFARLIPGSTLFRINKGYADLRDHPGYPNVPKDLAGRAFSLPVDAGEAIRALAD
ncbi:MAG: hypothetical protein IKD79_03340 [Oscillospiraceae bacterium]|nr:hypothetical protein [Oscillospiraceae bacterium]